MAVATSSHKRHFDLKTSKHGEIFGLFSHIITGDRVSKGKPCPEIFITAAAAFAGGAPQPCNTLVFEDAPSGVQVRPWHWSSVTLGPLIDLVQITSRKKYKK